MNMFGRIKSTSGSTKYLSTLAMAFAVVLGIVCFSSCGKPDEPKPTPPEDKDTKAPEITLKMTEINVYGGKVVTIDAGKLSIGGTEAATWADDKSSADKCSATLSFDGTTIKSGDTLDKAGTLTITVSDEAGNKAEKSITLTAQGIIGLENLNNLDLQIDKEVSIMDGITTAEGWTIAKVEIETIGGSRTEISAPYNFTPAEAGTIRIIITITDGTKTAEFCSDELTVKPMAYTSVSPAKAKIYPEFNNQNVEAHKREGTYEMLALANQCLDKNRRKENGLKVIMQSPGYNSGIQKYKSHFDSHEENCYRNLSEGTGDTENIYAINGRYKEIETYLNYSERNDTNIAYTTSRNLTGNTNLDNLNQNPHYQALKRLGKSNNFLGSMANGNANETDKDYKLSDDITDTSKFPENGYEYWETAAAKNDNNLQAVVCGYAKDKVIFKIYDNNGASSSCPLISKDNEIFVRCCSPFPTKDYNTLNADWGDDTRGNTSYATPELTAQWKNIYDVCHPLGIIGNMTELKALITKYARKLPCVIQTKDAEGKITEEPSGYGLVTNAVPIIEQEVIPAIASKCTPSADGIITLFKGDALRIAYQGAGVEYQAEDGTWKDTSGIPVSEYVDKPQRISHALQQKYGASAGASSTASSSGTKIKIYLLTADAEQIVSQEVSIP